MRAIALDTGLPRAKLRGGIGTMLPRKTLACALVCFSAILCAGGAEAQPSAAATAQPNTASTAKPAAKQVRTGRATVIAEKFEGRKTASGEPYDSNALLAAHRTYPFGTVLRVTNLKNGKAVDVRVVDRHARQTGPRQAIVDLSRAAAERLELGSSGQVRTEVVPQ